MREILTYGNDEQITLALTFLIELVSLGGKDISTALLSDTTVIRDLVFAQTEQLREKAACLFGTIASESPSPESAIRFLLRFGEGSVEKQHGGVSAVGTLLARLAIQGRLFVLSRETLDKFGNDLATIIVSPNSNTMLLEASLHSLSEICIFGGGLIFSVSHRDRIIARLKALSKSTRNGRLQDQAVLSLGYISFSLTLPDDAPIFDRILEALYNVHEQKQIELLFSAGQALSCVGARWTSKAMIRFRHAGIELLQEPLRGILDHILNRILEDVNSPKHPLRKVSPYIAIFT